jgi:hypothetical protein
MTGYDGTGKAASTLSDASIQQLNKNTAAATCFDYCALSLRHWMVGNGAGGVCQGLLDVPQRLRRRFSALDALIFPIRQWGTVYLRVLGAVSL